MDLAAKKSRVPHKGRWIVVPLVVVVLAMVLVMGYATWRWSSLGLNALAAGFQSPDMAAAQYTDRTVRANLGGVPVAIPPYFAEYVEYDGDPGWGEKRKGPKPVRTPESRIASFGFDVRYPDMAGKSTPELWEDYRKRRLATDQWLDVGFNSGEIYRGAGSADRIGNGTINSKSGYWFDRYEKLKENEYGLEVYALVGVEPKEGKPAREDKDAEDVFIKRGGDGKITTYISCSNRQIPSAPCEQHFDLEPEMHTSVTVGYRRGLLPEWQQIQEKVKNTVLGFAVNAQK
ncbi:hypothetical protein [Xylophilus ampelinus]|uniref:Uncharacterized protein n=1 Tax=Xylophilus ampelinus TaxID=54067 RepID=A0A318SRM2_9BURK|nr:hypothetical protein [Xylophilus ampelinus]MCS4511047.1 hypothetical protein [Xylophilus ampelinus]PYE75959.1 hypothetical protein DFQ15_11885 [Xylophilus ampelinus]